MKADKQKLRVDVQRASPGASTPGDHQFQLWFETALSGRLDTATLAIRIVDTEEARRFNRDYRGKDYATNVLSFPVELPAGLPSDLAESQLGDLLFCAPLVVSEAQEQAKAEQDHWAHLVVHGVLHLLGYDHECETDAQLMEKLEKQYLAELGIADPYMES